jgi:uncharacterized protein (TIGR00369 family)
MDNPFLEMLGIRLVRWTESEAEFTLELEPRHLNRQGILQGGLTATLLDAACGYSGLFVPPGAQPAHAATLALSVNFVSAGRHGTLRAVGRRAGGGRNIFFAEGDVRGENGVLVATGQGTFKYRLARSSQDASSYERGEQAVANRRKVNG